MLLLLQIFWGLQLLIHSCKGFRDTWRVPLQPSQE